MATSPATIPDAAPSEVAWPSRNLSISNQPATAAQVAVNVLINATPANPFAPRAEPALNPNQPNQSNPAPIITSGKLDGRSSIFPKPIRLPNTSASANPAAPAFICTAVPPAKSRALILVAIKPPPFAS